MRCQTRSWRPSAAAAGIHAVAALAGAVPVSPGDPFVFFNRLVTLDQADLTRIAEGDVAVRVLPGRDGHLGVFTAVRLDAPDEALVEWVREIEAFVRPERRRPPRFGCCRGKCWRRTIARLESVPPGATGS